MAQTDLHESQGGQLALRPSSQQGKGPANHLERESVSGVEGTCVLL